MAKKKAAKKATKKASAKKKKPTEAEKLVPYTMLVLGKVKSTDTAAKLKGMVTHAQIFGDLNCLYDFQPHGLTPTGVPAKSYLVSDAFITGGVFEERMLPLPLIGTKVEALDSGFKGTVVGLLLHPRECIHALVQAAGLNKDGKKVDLQDIDLSLLKGDFVPVFDKDYKKKHPSPSPVESVLG